MRPYLLPPPLGRGGFGEGLLHLGRIDRTQPPPGLPLHGFAAQGEVSTAGTLVELQPASRAKVLAGATQGAAGREVLASAQQGATV